MIPVLSRDQIRAFDWVAIDSGIPSLLLMENAGRGAAEVIERIMGSRKASVVVIAGPGNNGGDGFVVARRLRTKRVKALVFLTVPAADLEGDARQNYDAWLAVGGTVVDDALLSGASRLSEAVARAEIIVDALLGTGLDRDVAGPLAKVIEEINASPAQRVALDIPSGLCADTGRVLGAAVRAHETVTFAHFKKGLLTPGGAIHAGRVHLVDIGVPASLADGIGSAAQLAEATDIARVLGKRSLVAHKSTSGRVVVVAGSPGKTGAALLVARGALRAGAGLVTIATFAETARALDGHVLEVMTSSIGGERPEADLDAALTGADVVVIGPGLGLDERARRVTEHVVLRWEGAKVVDADALTHFSGRLAMLSRVHGLLLTPHPGEMGRLLGIGAAEVEADRFAAVERAVNESGAAVLLKGAHTVVGAPRQKPVINPTGTPALATAGSGDVLAGIAGAMLASCRDALHAGAAAAFVHGLVAERWSRAHGADRGMLAHEIADGVPDVIGELLEGRRAESPSASALSC